MPDPWVAVDQFGAPDWLFYGGSVGGEDLALEWICQDCRTRYPGPHEPDCEFKDHESRIVTRES